MAGPFSAIVDFMSAAGIFNYLALFLVLIVLYYLFLHLIGRHSGKRVLNRPWVRNLLSAVLAVLVTSLLYFGFFSVAGNATAVVVAVVFFVAVVFIILAVTGKLAGIDLPELLGVKDEK